MLRNGRVIGKEVGEGKEWQMKESRKGVGGANGEREERMRRG